MSDKRWDSFHLGLLIADIKLWAKEKGILDNGSGEAQARKTLEEAREIAVGIYSENKEDIKDGIGDTLVTLIIQAEMQGLTLLECLEHAYNQIKDRQGEMVGGTFVKNIQED